MSQKIDRGRGPLLEECVPRGIKVNLTLTPTLTLNPNPAGATRSVTTT